MTFILWSIMSYMQKFLQISDLNNACQFLIRIKVKYMYVCVKMLLDFCIIFVSGKKSYIYVCVCVCVLNVYVCLSGARFIHIHIECYNKFPIKLLECVYLCEGVYSNRSNIWKYKIIVSFFSNFNKTYLFAFILLTWIK
jgi:hypothetical protein